MPGREFLKVSLNVSTCLEHVLILSWRTLFSAHAWMGFYDSSMAQLGPGRHRDTKDGATIVDGLGSQEISRNGLGTIRWSPNKKMQTRANACKRDFSRPPVVGRMIGTSGCFLVVVPMIFLFWTIANQTTTMLELALPRIARFTVRKPTTAVGFRITKWCFKMSAGMAGFGVFWFFYGWNNPYHTIYGTGIFTYICLIFIWNVGK